ncbi:hypothetical protein KJ632_02425 [Patescibacteria group bacterium]|nr:hypothetical protein [Patescibacteria group bacterium]
MTNLPENGKENDKIEPTVESISPSATEETAEITNDTAESAMESIAPSITEEYIDRLIEKNEFERLSNLRISTKEVTDRKLRHKIRDYMDANVLKIDFHGNRSINKQLFQIAMFGADTSARLTAVEILKKRAFKLGAYMKEEKSNSSSGWTTLDHPDCYLRRIVEPSRVNHPEEYLNQKVIQAAKDALEDNARKKKEKRDESLERAKRIEKIEQEKDRFYLKISKKSLTQKRMQDLQKWFSIDEEISITEIDGFTYIPCGISLSFEEILNRIDFAGVPLSAIQIDKTMPEGGLTYTPHEDLDLLENSSNISFKDLDLDDLPPLNEFAPEDGDEK